MFGGNYYMKKDIPEPIKACFNCKCIIDWNKCDNRDYKSYKEFIYTTFKTGICNNYISFEEKPKETEPEKSDSININIYKNGLLKDSLAIKGEIFRKAKPEKSIGKSNSYYKGYEDCEKELPEKILKDLDELIAWSNNYPKDSEI